MSDLDVLVEIWKRQIEEFNAKTGDSIPPPPPEPPPPPPDQE